MASQDWFDKDFYKVLGVAKDVSDADLKKTYRKLARKYHPDSNQGDAAAEAKFKEISEAYSVLSDKEQRAEYDQIRAMGSGARFTAGGQGGRRLRGRVQQVRPRSRRRRAGSQQADFDDIFAMFNQQQGGGFGTGRFGQPSGGFRGYGGPQRGADVTARTTIDFVTATKGETITLQGEDGKPFKVKIPAGVADGQKIRLRGRGRPSPDGGETGRHRRAGHRAAASGVHARRAQPARDGAGHLHRGGARRDDRGSDARRRPREAARRSRTPSGRVLRVKGRGVTTPRARETSSPRSRSPSRRTWTMPRARRCERFHELEPKENPRADLMAKARG